jgi:hypothetical protein
MPTRSATVALGAAPLYLMLRLAWQRALSSVALCQTFDNSPRWSGLSAAASPCQLDAMLAHDLETLWVRPRRKSSANVASSPFLPLGGRCGPAADNVLAS